MDAHTVEMLESHPWVRFGLAREVYETLSGVFHTLARRFHFGTDPFAPMPEIAAQVLLLPLSLTASSASARDSLVVPPDVEAAMRASRQVVEQLQDSRLSFTDVCTWHGKVTASAALSLRPLVGRIAAVQRFMVHDTDKQFGLSPGEQAMLLYDSDEGVFRLPAATCALLAQNRPLVSLREFLKTFGEPAPFAFPALAGGAVADSASPSPGSRRPYGQQQQQRSVTFVDARELLSATDKVEAPPPSAALLAPRERIMTAAAAMHYALRESSAPVAVVNSTPLQSSDPRVGSEVQLSIALGPRTASNPTDAASLLAEAAEEEAEAAAAGEPSTADSGDGRSPSGKEIAGLIHRASEVAAAEPQTQLPPAQLPPRQHSPSMPRPYFRDLNERMIAVLAVRAAAAAYADSKTDAVSRFLIGLDTAESSVPFAADIRAALGHLDFDKSFTLRAPTDRAKNQVFIIDLPALYIVAVAGVRAPADMVDMCDFLPLIDPLRGPREHPAAFHKGIYRRAVQLPPLAEMCPNPRKPVLLTGHGLGGAICDVYLRLFAGEADRAPGSFLVTFGAPHPHRCVLVDQHKAWRFVAEGDFVPAVLSLGLPRAVAYEQPPRQIRVRERTGAPNVPAPRVASRQRPFEDVVTECMLGPHEATRYVANIEHAAVFSDGAFPPDVAFIKGV